MDYVWVWVWIQRSTEPFVLRAVPNAIAIAVIAGAHTNNFPIELARQYRVRFHIKICKLANYSYQNTNTCKCNA